MYSPSKRHSKDYLDILFHKSRTTCRTKSAIVQHRALPAILHRQSHRRCLNNAKPLQRLYLELHRSGPKRAYTKCSQAAIKLQTLAWLGFFSVSDEQPKDKDGPAVASINSTHHPTRRLHTANVPPNPDCKSNRQNHPPLRERRNFRPPKARLASAVETGLNSSQRSPKRRESTRRIHRHEFETPWE